MDNILFLLLTIIVLLIVITILAKLEWLIREMRNICNRPSGYFKFGQLILLMFCLLVLLNLLVINILERRETSSLDIFLTVIVGFLGTIFGLYFGSKGESEVSKSQRSAMSEAKQLLRDLRKRVG